MQGDTPGREVVQPIELDNCDGKADAKRIEHRTRSVESTISAEVAAKFGVSAEVLSAEVQATVGAAIGVTDGQGTSIELVAPPGTRMAFQLVWIGNEQVGIVQNLRASNIPIAFRSFRPTDVRIKSQYNIGCPPTPTAQPSALAPQSTIISLNYIDPTGGIQFAQGQTEFVAIYLQIVQAGGSLEEAIQSIKQQAANARATVQEGNSISIQQLQAYLVWCPNADCAYPTNTVFPLKGFRQDYSKVALIEVGESRMVQCPSNCWAVAVR